MPHLAISLLGPVQIAVDGQTVDFAYAKVRALLIYLVVERHPHTRDALAELLWPDQEPQISRSSLRQALTRLRQLIRDHEAAPPFLLTTRETLQFNPASTHTLDTATFARLLQDGEQKDAPETARLACFEQAITLYRGGFADGAIPRDSAGFEEWALLQREAFERQTRSALDYLAGSYERQQHYEAALRYARRRIELDPWYESAHRCVMRVLAAQGQRRAALAQYEHCRRLLAAELGVEPEPETKALYEQLCVLAEQPPARLRPEDIPSVTYPLPSQSTTFVGREREQGDIEQLLLDPGCRLLTLLGPGGIGKTRLAQQVAEQMMPRFRHGVCWIPLAAVPSPEFLVDAIARSLGCKIGNTINPLEALLAFVEPRQVLLVLDNFEHLVDSADTLVALLDHAPYLKILITSRESVQLQREWIYDLAGLPYPSDTSREEPAEVYGAVRLFLERAQQVRRQPSLEDGEHQAARQIAQLVEGMPLALELAAAASRQRSFGEIVDSLQRSLDMLRASFRDLPERHRSMRAAIEHSWRLLDAEEQRIVMALSVFRGGFDTDGAHRIAAAAPSHLHTLVHKSLLREHEDRYDMHELIRQFAEEQLAAEGMEDTTRAAHLAYTVALAEEASPHLARSKQLDWLERLEQEHANIRAALRWALDHRQQEQATRIGGAIWRFWWMRGHMVEGRRWLAEALAHTHGIEPATRAKAARGAGSLANQQGDYSTAREYHTLSLEIEQELENLPGIANALGSLARVARNQGDHNEARKLLEESVAIHQKLGNDVGVANSIDGLAEVAQHLGEYDRARHWYEQSLPLHRKVGNTLGLAIGLLNLSDMACAQGNDDLAEPDAREALQLFQSQGNKLGMAAGHNVLGTIAYHRGNYSLARTHYAEAVTLLQAIHVQHQLVLVLLGLINVAGALKQYKAIAQVSVFLERLNEAAPSSVVIGGMQEYEQTRDAAQHALGEQAWLQARVVGESLTLDKAIKCVLDATA